jgi:hypothetical protein
MSALLISCWSKAYAAHGTLIHVVGVLFMCLHISTELNDCVFCI